jgi:hypothetical protein
MGQRWTLAAAAAAATTKQSMNPAPGPSCRPMAPTNMHTMCAMMMCRSGHCGSAGRPNLKSTASRPPGRRRGLWARPGGRARDHKTRRPGQQPASGSFKLGY